MQKFMIVNLVSFFLTLAVPCLVSAQEGGDVFRKYEADVSKGVDRGLEYLLSVEQKDGTFPGAFGRSTGISSLVGLCFLSKGHTPDKGRFGEALKRRIQFALEHTSGDGLIQNGDQG